MSSPRRPGFSHLALLAVALLLPAVSLIPLGSLWLWERGYIIYWALGTFLIVTAAYALLRRLLQPLALEQMSEGSKQSEPSPQWSARQVEAWSDVGRLANAATSERLSSRDAALGLALETIELVAKRMHPERRDPLLQFTLPEAFAVIERVSSGLREFVAANLPMGDRIAVAQLMWLYRWRNVLPLAEKGYDLWRVIRLLNPVSAATQELRERFTRQIYDMGREHLARRLARAFVEEVGRAAIDLYGGNLRVTGARLAEHVSTASRRDIATLEAVEAEPIRILVAGQTGAGKSSLLNALGLAVDAAVDALPTTTRYTAYRLTHEGIPAALVIDSPGINASTGLPELIDNADDCDMILWVSAATRAAREADRRALDAIRAHFAQSPSRRRPPMLLVLTHIDVLRPFGEWQPPYDLADKDRAKAVSILDAMEVAGSELGFDGGDIVPVRTDAAAATYNVDAVWAKIIELAPEVQRARLVRCLSDINSASGWATVWSQAANAGRVFKGTFLSRNRSTAPWRK